MRPLTLASTVLLALAANAQPAALDPDVWAPRVFVDHPGDPLPYRVATPDLGAFPGPRPLVVFLHGAGERGADNARQLVHGADRLAEGAAVHGAVVVAPQCPRADYWANVGRAAEAVTGRPSLDWAYRPDPTPALRAVAALVDSLAASSAVDPAQVHLVGISMGGMGVLELAARHPARFASVTSLAGAYGPQVAPILARTPRLRFFHGGADEVVHHAVTAELIAQLRAEGADPVYVEYPGVGHDSWTRSFARDDFWTWIWGG